MKPPTINLARRPFRNNTLYYGVFGACAILLLAATGYNASEFAARGEQLQALRDQSEQRTAAYKALFEEVEQMKKSIAEVNLATLDTKSTFANGLIVAQFFSWSSLFDRMESIIPDDVKVRSIRPSISPKEIEIQVDGMARTANALYEFEAALDHSPYFSSVYPVSEDSRQAKNEINFDLVMKYVPGGATGSQPESPTAWLPQAEPKPEAEAGEAEAGATDSNADAGQGGLPQQPSASATGSAAGQRPPPTEPTAPQVPTVPEADRHAAVPASPQGAPGPSPVRAADVPQPHPPPPAAGPATADAGAQPGGAAPPSAAAPAPEIPLNRISNGELLQAKGQEEFLKMWGDLRPRDSSAADADLTNEAFIKKNGVDQFIKVRGSLTRVMQTKGLPSSKLTRTP